MSINNLYMALKEIAGEKNLPMQVLLNAIQEALVIAYRKNFDSEEDVTVSLDQKTGHFRVVAKRTVVENDDAVEEVDKQYTLEEARELKPDAQVGEVIEEDVTPESFGRIATQTAKQVVSQKIREAERNIIYQEFQDRVGQVLSGKVQRVDRGTVYVDFARAEAVLPPKEQIPGEVFRTNDRIKCYVTEVKTTPRGPQIILSRSSPRFVEKLFEQAVPEIPDGIVEVKSVSREPGLRVKIAVHSKEERVDPVGACVGLKGSRIKTIVDELNGEKIDIVRYSPTLTDFITNALSPAKVLNVTLNPELKSALVIVDPTQLSLAIGKDGLNVKLASKLTLTKIDIKTEKDLQQAQEPKVPATE